MKLWLMIPDSERVKPFQNLDDVVRWYMQEYANNSEPPVIDLYLSSVRIDKVPSDYMVGLSPTGNVEVFQYSYQSSDGSHIYVRL